MNVLSPGSYRNNVEAGQSSCSAAAHLIENRRGQALVEFDFILPIFLFLLLGVIQMIIVGGAALAVNQAAISSARYASLNPNSDEATVNTYMKGTASPLINDTNLHSLVLSPITKPRQTGNSLSVKVTYDLKGKLFLGASFFGVSFPTQVSVTHTMTSE
jgi:Flp pilus assembly protein TadG